MRDEFVESLRGGNGVELARGSGGEPGALTAPRSISVARLKKRPRVKTKKGRTLRPETISAQACGVSDKDTGAVVPPIHVATTFVRDEDNSYRKGFCYGRSDNATVRHVEAVLANLEHGSDAVIFASGMAAATAAFLALRRPAHVVAADAMYWGLRQWLTIDGPAYGIDVTFVDASKPEAVSKAMKPGTTRLVWIETPSNPMCAITDIAAVAKIAHAGGALFAVDSTVSTPVLTNPTDHGADIVAHSATKYLNGHSDVMAGALVFSQKGPAHEAVLQLRTNLGGVIGGLEAGMLLRGMRTLHLRVRHQSAAALEIARRFVHHPAIRQVLYPGLARHEGHEIAARQMIGGFGGMLSLRLKRGMTAAVETAARLQVWKRATSLGGVESLVEHRASMEGDASPCPRDLLRLSVGIESVDDLIADLEEALP